MKRNQMSHSLRFSQMLLKNEKVNSYTKLFSSFNLWYYCYNVCLIIVSVVIQKYPLSVNYITILNLNVTFCDFE